MQQNQFLLLRSNQVFVCQVVEKRFHSIRNHSFDQYESKYDQNIDGTISKFNEIIKKANKTPKLFAYKSFNSKALLGMK